MVTVGPAGQLQARGSKADKSHKRLAAAADHADVRTSACGPFQLVQEEDAVITVGPAGQLQAQGSKAGIMHGHLAAAK